MRINSMKKVFESLKPFKLPLMLLGGFGIVILIFGVVMPTIRDAKTNKSPIKSIKATNDTIYEIGDEIVTDDFKVKAIHENGKTTSISDRDIGIDKKDVSIVGKYTEVTVFLKENPKVNTVCKVKNEREKLEEYDCGNPNLKSVKAVIYSNGELRFEGKGNVLEYANGEAPWQNAENTINSVTFDPDVTPKSMDHWFEDFDELTFIDKLPSSVQSVVSMCSGCLALREAADWTDCTELLDISSAYEGCESLYSVPKLPKSVRNATNTFADCIRLQKSPDMTDAVNLVDATSMYEGCTILTSTDTLPHVKKADNMYASCINLQTAPQFNEGVVSLNGTFSDNVALETAARIPESAQDISDCYSGCTKLKGDIVVDASPENYSSFIANAANATKINLKGKSKILNELALTNDSENVTVNGKTPVKED